MSAMFKRIGWRLRRWFGGKDDYEETVRGLRRALATQQRAVEDLRQQVEERDRQAERMRAEYAALEMRLQQAKAEGAQAAQLEWFRQLQPVLVHLPTLRAAAGQGADITARDVLGLLAPLDELLDDHGFVRIGEAGAEISFAPRLHRPVGQGAANIQPGETVRVRYVGYCWQEDVLVKAEVTCKP